MKLEVIEIQIQNSYLIHIHSFKWCLQKLEVVNVFMLQLCLKLYFLQANAPWEQHVHELAVSCSCNKKMHWHYIDINPDAPSKDQMAFIVISRKQPCWVSLSVVVQLDAPKIYLANVRWTVWHTLWSFSHSFRMHAALLYNNWRTTMTNAKWIFLLFKTDVLGVPVHSRTVHTVRRSQADWKSSNKLLQTSQPPEFSQAKILFFLATEVGSNPID